jgi:hypothetical protein
MQVEPRPADPSLKAGEARVGPASGGGVSHICADCPIPTVPNARRMRAGFVTDPQVGAIEGAVDVRDP